VIRTADTLVASNELLDTPPSPGRSRFEESWRLFRANRLALIGLGIFLIFFCVALLGVFLTSGSNPVFDPALVRLEEKLRPPLSRPNLDALTPAEVPALGVYLFGTDELGRDVFSRMLQGAWVSLTVGFVAVGLSVLIGIIMGGLAGYFGQARVTFGHLLICLLLGTGSAWLVAGNRRLAMVLLLTGGAVLYISLRDSRSRQNRVKEGLWLSWSRLPVMTVETLIMRIVDIMLCFPSFFLILTVVAILPASMYNIMIVIGLTSWMGAARFVRAEFLSLREQDFVTAAQALGVGRLRIIFRHMMPNALGPVLVSATIGIASAILTEAGLSFLGFGVPPPHATWGNILSGGKNFIFDAPWLTFIPGFAILIVVLSFNLFGEGLRDILNPKLRKRS
jgi:peptide/nickel transport system permease protein